MQKAFNWAQHEIVPEPTVIYYVDKRNKNSIEVIERLKDAFDMHKFGEEYGKIIYFSDPTGAPLCPIKRKSIKESSDEEMDIKDLSSAKEQEYYKYLKIHEVRLKASFNDRIYALKNALLLSKEQCEELKERILKHDASRYTPEEWDNWRKSYFPINDKEKEEGEKTEKEARKHHYKVNAHHPEHWNGKEMDKVSIAEMIIDWEADSKADGGNPLKWWLYNDEAKEKKKLLNPKTREEVERVLQTIYDVNMNLKDNFDRIDDPKKAD